MIDFKRVQLSDKHWMDPLIAAADMRGCHQNYTNIFAWSETFNYRVAKVNNFLVVKGENEEYPPYYFFPAGQGEIKNVFEAMKQDAADCGHEFILAGVSSENIEVMNTLYPDSFEYQEMREGFDYLYFIEKMVSLKGNKLHSKRNHINRFVQNNPNWTFEPITPDNLGECWEMNQEWCRINSRDEDETLARENCAVRRCFDYFVPLGLEGGLIRVDGRVIAYTMGEKLNSDTYVIHVEKAYSSIQGAYQIINREFAAWIHKNYPELIYVNREEDLGLEGLRKAKLSYHPDRMEEKYIAKYFTV